jgi:hypothetical protein
MGIGDATPDGKLEVRQTGTDDIFNLFDNTTNVFTVEDGGNVGIGATSPATKLDVAGTVQMTGFKLTTAPTAGYVLASDAAGVGTWTDPTTITTADDGDWTISGSDIYSTVAGNVGIGVSSPATPLAIMGNGGTNPVGITQNQVGGTSTMEFTTIDGGGLQASRLVLRGNGDDADIEFYSGARGAELELMHIEGSNGNVGIGTSSPATKLEVAGVIKSNQTSYQWYSGLDLVLHTSNTANANIIHYSPGASNYGRVYRTSSSGTVLTLLPLAGLPETVYGSQVNLVDVTIYYKVSSGDYINSTIIQIGELIVASDNTNRTSTTLASYTIPIGSDVTGDVTISFNTVHDGSGTGNLVDIPRIRAGTAY